MRPSQEGPSHLRGPRHGARRAALQRRAWLSRRKHTTGPASPATRARWARRARRGLRGAPPAGPCLRGVQPDHSWGRVPSGRTHLAASHGRAQTAAMAIGFCNRKAHAAGLCTGVEGGGARDMDAGHRPGAVKPLGLRGILQVRHDTAAAACGGDARSSTTSSEARRINPKRQVLKRPRVTAC
jgi:hypothetical protein